MSATPYLTVNQVAEHLRMTPDGVRKLIKSGKLTALRVSERKTLIPTAALHAYQRKLRGESSTIAIVEDERTLSDLSEDFEHRAGMSALAFLASFKRGKVARTAESLELVSQAASIAAAQAREPVIAGVRR